MPELDRRRGRPRQMEDLALACRPMLTASSSRPADAYDRAEEDDGDGIGEHCPSEAGEASARVLFARLRAAGDVRRRGRHEARMYARAQVMQIGAKDAFRRTTTSAASCLRQRRRRSRLSWALSPQVGR